MWRLPEVIDGSQATGPELKEIWCQMLAIMPCLQRLYVSVSLECHKILDLHSIMKMKSR